MNKLCLNTRDELLIIDLGEIAYLQANGNYTQLAYIGGMTQLLTISISRMEEYASMAWGKDSPTPFIRLGRSLVINRKYLAGINVLKKKLVLSDWNSHSYSLTIPQQVAKELKAKVHQAYSASDNNVNNVNNVNQ